MLGSNQWEASMLDNTLAMFRNNSQPISSDQGIMLIDGWLQALQGDPNMNQLTGQLTELRTALQDTSPDTVYIRQLMGSLADKAQAIAEDENAEGTWTGGLESLSKILRHYGDQAS
ncbi:hypothetical protein [Spirosoma aerolatum]|uniref:hypothetical protein n=1 Tax=Spirosoma aerolatum TaxID=1211326 RepID=UPI0009ADF7AB|nr:hypothetical protein [Spirosoma aerolatum]